MKVAYNQHGELITMLQKYHKSIAVFFLIIFSSFICNSCAYYKKKVLSDDQITLKKISKNIAKGKQFVLITQTETWKANNVKLTEGNFLSMDLSSIDNSLIEDKLAYLDSTSKSRVKPNKGDRILQQLVIVHSLSSTPIDSGIYSLAISDIDKIEVYDADIGKSLGFFAITVVGIMVILAIIVVLTKSSCPFLYVYDGEDYQLAAETFGGAIYPGLERSDFIGLPMAQTKEGFYEFKIRNELKERQYINKVRLIEAKLPDHKYLNIDQDGIIHTIGTPISPKSALSDSYVNYTDELARIDSTQFYFDGDGDVNSIALDFDKPKEATTGKLILKTKSTLWMDYVFGEFLKLFGSYYNTFANEQKKKTKEQMRQWSEDQNLPLTVSLYTNGEWVEIEQLQPIGPLAAARDVVIPIDLKEINDDNIKVKLSTGFYFWELDYAGMDYSIDEPIETKYAVPAFVEFNSDNISNEALNNDDSLYVVQNDVGDVLDLKFATQFDSDTETMVFLEVSGYYTHIREFNTIPEFETLKTFKNPGRLSEFSKELFYYYSAPILANNMIEE